MKIQIDEKLSQICKGQIRLSISPTKSSVGDILWPLVIHLHLSYFTLKDYLTNRNEICLKIKC